MDATLGNLATDFKEQVRDISRGVVDLIEERTEDIRETSTQNCADLRRVEEEVKALQALYEQAVLRESRPTTPTTPLRGRRLRKALLAFADLVDALEDTYV